MNTRLTALLIIVLLLLPAPYAAGQAPLSAPPAKPVKKLGLALAGGGAKGAASLGVLKVLVREGIPIAAIAGTSMGADVGGFYAAGYSPDDIEQIFLDNDWNDIFSDTPPRAFLTQEQKEAVSRHLLEFTFDKGRFTPPSGLSAGQKVTKLFASKTLAASFEADLDFDRLKVPFRAVATDIETGEAVVIRRGLLHEAMRASTAIPVVFQPVEIEGRMLVDGGLSNNMPVDVVRGMGVDVVIAVDASKKLEKKEQLTSLLDIMSQSISLQVQRESVRQTANADLVIMPDTTDFTFTDFPAMHEIMKKGEEAAQAALPRIRELLHLTGADTQTEPAPPAHTDAPVVRHIDVSGNTLITTPDILAALAWQAGMPFDHARVRAELDKLVASCRARGYLLTRIEHLDLDAATGTLRVVLYEGRVDSVTLAGQTKTRQSLIMREIQIRDGAPLNFNDAAYDIQHLYALDYFESLSLDMKKSGGGGIDLSLRIKEKPTTRVRLGLRYDLEDRFTGLTDIIMDNVTGRGIKAFLQTRYGNYTDITAGYHSPVFLDAFFVHSVQAFYRERRYLVYEDKHTINELRITRTGVDFSFGYQWFRFGDTYLRYRYSTDSTHETLGADPSRELMHIGSLAFLSTIDTRDRAVFPHSGVLFKGSYEAAHPDYGSGMAFNKASVYLEGDIPLAEHHTLVLEASGGFGSGSLPYQEKFGIGGADYLLGYPLAGYQRREFTGSNELGFSAAYRWKMLEYQLKAVRAVYLNLAGQAANVWDDRDTMTVDRLRTGASVGLHADTLLGPMRLDMGAGDQRRYAVYFSMGFDF